jgi:hypothetical protein
MSVKNFVKLLLIKNEITMTELVNVINEKFERNDTIQNLNNKLTKETIRYTEMLELADALDYDIIWSPKSQRKNRSPLDTESVYAPVEKKKPSKQRGKPSGLYAKKSSTNQ